MIRGIDMCQNELSRPSLTHHASDEKFMKFISGEQQGSGDKWGSTHRMAITEMPRLGPGLSSQQQGYMGARQEVRNQWQGSDSQGYDQVSNMKGLWQSQTAKLYDSRKSMSQKATLSPCYQNPGNLCSVI